jgi:hypothetical protein
MERSVSAFINDVNEREGQPGMVSAKKYLPREKTYRLI